MDELIPLRNGTLGDLPSDIRVPRYDRTKLTPGMVHIGLGNFHRAHQAWYLHRLFDEGLNHDWAIIGAGVRPADAVQRARLMKQDWLTTLIELDPSGKSAEVAGAMIDFVPVEEGHAALIGRITRPDIRIVSLTVTEGGYYINPSSGGFDVTHSDIRHDSENPTNPRTAFGAIVEALRLRRENGDKPFTCLSCDNLQGNGAILQRTVVSLARMSNPDLAGWIEQFGAFPNSMVDCIVPATGPAELKLAQSFGIDDASPVTHENFRQWVIEDNFCNGRPDWDAVGATFSDDVQLHEAMKLRILNGGHQIVAIPGELLGLRTIDEAMAHPLIHGFFTKVVRDEIAPHVSPVPGTSPTDYLQKIRTRFANSEIKDTTRRVAFDGSSRQPCFLFPAIRDGLKSGTPISGLTLATVLWCRYCEGIREDGSAIEPNDPNWSMLNETALAAKDDPAIWVGQRDYYGDLADDSHFLDIFRSWHQMVADCGVAISLKRYLSISHAHTAFA